MGNECRSRTGVGYFVFLNRILFLTAFCLILILFFGFSKMPQLFLLHILLCMKK